MLVPVTQHHVPAAAAAPAVVPANTLVPRRALLPLPLALLLLQPPLPAPAADTFEYVSEGKVEMLTELQARDKLTKKVRPCGVGRTHDSSDR